jgi:calmodulin-regulated spectrin-associated protein
MYHPIQQQQQFGSTPHLSMKPQHHQYINEQGQYINQKMYSRENSRIIDDQYATPPSQYLNQEKQKNIAKYVQDTNHYRDQYEPQQTQFFLHGDPQTPPQPPARRTWAQQQQQQPKQQPEMSSWSQQAQQSWKSSSPSQKSTGSGGGFVLHQNGGRESQGEVAQRLFPVVHAVHNKPQAQQPTAEDMMAPQSISFIGDEDDEPDNFAPQRMDDLEVSLGKLNITSGSRTYRIPSPTTRNHPGLAANSFQSMESQNDAENEKGFYISFDNETQPKRPKPPLRTKRSPKKPLEEEEQQEIISKKVYGTQEAFKPQTPNERLSYNLERSPSQPEHRQSQLEHRQSQMQQHFMPSEPKESKALLIGNDEKTLDPVRFGGFAWGNLN